MKFEIFVKLVSQVSFHPIIPDNLIICSDGGSLIRADFTKTQLGFVGVNPEALQVGLYQEEKTHLGITSFDIDPESGVMAIAVAAGESLILKI